MSDEHRAKIAASQTRVVPLVEKECARCHLVKSAAEFKPRKGRGGRTLLHCYCRPCERAYGRERAKRYWDAHPEMRPRQRANNRKTTLKRYGLTPEQYDTLLAGQGGGCAICGTTDPGRGHLNLAVDHCHDSDQVRGLLCHSCNRVLGLFSDDAARLRAAAEYVERLRLMPQRGAA